MDRMTVDGALAALAIAVAWYSRIESPVRLYTVLAMAFLARETGVLLVAACCVVDLLAKRFKRAAIWAPGQKAYSSSWPIASRRHARGDDAVLIS